MKIRVSFVDASSQKLLGETELEGEQLPESFAHDTTLQLGGSAWRVESADPITRAEYTATGTLRLVLRRALDPQQILYSLPTLENALPPLAPGDTEAAHVLHEDDWRQRELVAARFEPEVAAELAEIRAIKAERTGAGFKRLHVRSRIPEPLAGTTLDVDTLRSALGEVARREVAIGGAIVEGGFAFRVGDAVIYGREADGRIQVLAFTRGTDTTALRALAKQHALLVVDWLATTSSQ